MQTTIEFIEAVKVKRGIESDYALSKFLGVERSTISSYRHKGTRLDDDQVLKVAEALGLDAGYVAACVHAERAKCTEVKSMWRHVAERLGGVAAACIVGLGLSSAPTPAPAAEQNVANTVYYVK